MYHRMPISFGPSPGPRQSLLGHPHNGNKSTSSIATITFKTSQATLQTLLPHSSFKFQLPGSEGFASLSVKTLDKLEWLGGQGYNLYSLYIHGIQYNAADGRQFKGSYLPVLFEDLADPIITGREELGYPKLFCDMDIHRTQDEFSMRASWRGEEFSQFRMSGLSKAEDSWGGLAPKDAGEESYLLLYKYIPAVGKPGVADVEYPVAVSYKKEKASVQSTARNKYTAAEASFNFDEMNWEKLPTLHHVIERIAHIPVSEVVGGSIINTVGVSDLASATRIE